MAETLWHRLQSALEGGMRPQVTRTGLLFTLTILLVGLAALVSANNLIFLLVAALLATLLISGFISRLGLAGLELDLELPDHIPARRKVTGHLILNNKKRWVPSFSIHLTGAPESGLTNALYLPVIPGGATIREPVELLFTKRGLYRENAFFFTSRFPFGFTQRRAQVRLVRDVLVYPSIDPQPGFEDLLSIVAGELESAQRGRGHDFYRIRPYEILESSRHVDWKATAHTGDLQIREFAREQDQAVTIFLDLDVSHADEAWFEMAVDCSAFLAWQLSLRSIRTRFVTQRNEFHVPDSGSVYTILRYLARVAPSQGLDLPIPDDDSSFQIALSANAERVVEAGWVRARVLGVRDLAGTDTAGPGQERTPPG
ncbi:MAG: DUF58 domain-containing protein [Bryobacteraceae bacterium]